MSVVLQVESSLAARCATLEAQVEHTFQQPDPPGVSSLVAGLGSLQAAAEDLQDRYERLEAQAAVIIQQKHVGPLRWQWQRS